MPLYAPGGFNGGTITDKLLTTASGAQIQFNGTSASFVGLKGTATQLDIVLADNSGPGLLSANAFIGKSGANSSLYAWGTNGQGFGMASGLAIWWTNSVTDGNATRDTGMARAAAGRIEVNSSAAGTFRDLIARQLFAGGDNAGLASSTSLTNAISATVTNAYVVAGGQAATTPNTGWIKIYVGTTVAWVPYWANATP